MTSSSEPPPTVVLGLGQGHGHGQDQQLPPYSVSESESVSAPTNNEPTNPAPNGNATSTSIPMPPPPSNPSNNGSRQSHRRQRHFPFNLSFLLNRQGRRHSSHNNNTNSNHFPRMLSSHRSAFTYTCFSCLHVRTMTILIGVWYLMLYILALSFMTALLMYNKPDGDNSMGSSNVIVTNPVAMTTKHNGNNVGVFVPPLTLNDDLDNIKLELGLENIDNTNSGGKTGQQKDDDKKPQNDGAGAGNIAPAAGEYDPDGKETSMDSYTPTYSSGGGNHRTNSQFLLLTFCNLLITLLLLYGTLRSKPSYLMPFFILKVFEFCIYCLSMIGLLSYLPNIGNHIIQMQGDSSASPQTTHLLTPLLSLPPPILSLLTFLFIISSVVIKAYVLNVVWNCYKYLMVRNSMIGAPGGSGRWDIRGSNRDSENFGRVRGLRRLNSFDQWLEDYINSHRHGSNTGGQNNLTTTVDLPDYETAVSDPRYARKPAEGTPGSGTTGVVTATTENSRSQAAVGGWAPVPPPPEYSQI